MAKLISLNRFRRTQVSLLLTIGLAFAASSTFAETFSFPKDEPVWKVELSAGWQANYTTQTPAQATLSKKDGDDLMQIRSLIEGEDVTDDGTAKGALCKIATDDVMKQLSAASDVKCGDVSELQIAGHKAFKTEVSYSYHDRPIKSVGYLFTPDGETYFFASGKPEEALSLIKSAK